MREKEHLLQTEDHVHEKGQMQKIPPLGMLLRQYRIATGMTQEELAERAGVSARSVSNIERGVPHTPRATTLRLLIDALGLTDAQTDRLWLVATQGPRHQTVSDAEASYHLPIPPSRLIGREADVRALSTLLTTQQTQIVTICGAPGVGKTRLMLEVAASVTDSFADGSIFVSLAPLRDISLVASTIARAVGVTEQGDRPQAEYLVATLRLRHLLLLLDNFEHVVAASPLIAEMLASCPYLTVCVTSRSPLYLRGEQRYAVAPLALPELGTADQRVQAAETRDTVGMQLTFDAFAAVPSVALLVERAHAARWDFAVTPDNATAVAAICHRLDGLPLALELAAAQLALFSPQELLDRLDHVLDLLGNGPQDLPFHQHTLRSALAWSHDMLSAPQRAVFRWLAVCAGGCTLEDAEALCIALEVQATQGQGAQTIRTGIDIMGQKSAPMRIEPRPLELVARLLDQSLLRRWETTDGAAGSQVRIGMLEVVREFAGECLRVSGEESMARRVHAAHFAALAERAAGQLAGPEQARWLDQLDREAANLREALAWASTHPGRLNRELERVSETREIALRLGGTLWRYWYKRGILAEGAQWLERILACWCLPVEVGLADAGDEREVTAPVSEASTLLSEESPRSVQLPSQDPDAALADVLYGAGVLAFTRSDYLRAQARYDACLAHRQALGDMRGVAQALNGLGGVARERGQLEVALTLYEASLETLTKLADQASGELARANARNNIGIVRAARGEFEPALVAYSEALAAYRRMEDRYMVGRCLANMGYCLCELGSYSSAQALLDESLALHQTAHDEHGIAMTVATLGLVAARQGNSTMAKQCLIEAATLYQHVGQAVSVVQCLEEIAILHTSLEDAGVDASQNETAGKTAGEVTSILGAIDLVRSRLGAPIEPVRATRVEIACVAARRILGESDYAVAWSSGRALAEGRAVEETLKLCLTLLTDDI